MTNPTVFSERPEFPDQLDWETLPPTTISLSPAQLTQAALAAQAVGNPTQQWQSYLTGLAQIGFCEWLQERAPELLAPTPDSQPIAAQTILQATLQVGAAHVSIIATGCVDDTVVPIALAQVTQTPSQFYALVTVLEEQSQVQVLGYLRRDRLLMLLDSGSDQILIPYSEFTLDPDAFLFDLRTASAPVVAPDLVPTPAPRSQPLINAGVWLRDRLDQAAQELAWVLMPPLTPATALRSATDTLDHIVTELIDRGITIAREARGAYRDFHLGIANLRLYAVAWALPATFESPGWQWRLLLVVVPQASYTMPAGLCLQVQDASQILVEQSNPADNPQGCLFAEIEGDWGEIFQVKVITAEGLTAVLPPFAFSPTES
jgi:Protein of unknown function (DUF1822)